MLVTMIDLRRENVISFGSGVEVRCRLTKKDEGTTYGTVAIEYPSGQRLFLPNAAQVRNATGVLAIQGAPKDRLFVAGGPMLYELDDSGKILQCISTTRDYEFERLWETEIFQVDGATLILYERFMMLLDDLLNVRWHVEKEWVDLFLGIDEANGAILLLRDWEEEIWVSLQTGRTMATRYGSGTESA